MMMIKKKKKKKKQSIVSNWERHETTVVEILIRLMELIPENDYSSFAWGAKRRRSKPKPLLPVLVTKSVKAGNAATSPATPLIFSASESDDKATTKNTNTPSPVSLPVSDRKLQNKEELMQGLTEFTHQKDSLVKMEAARHHFDTLGASNLELRNRKQEIIYRSSPTAPTYQTHSIYQQLHYPFQLLQQQPAIQKWSTSALPPASNKMASVGLPDLNLTFEEFAASAAGNMERGVYEETEANANNNAMMVMDYNVNNKNTKSSRALASAQARKRRMQIYKEKNQNLALLSNF